MAMPPSFVIFLLAANLRLSSLQPAAPSTRTRIPASATTGRAKTTTLTGSSSGPTTGPTRARICYEVADRRRSVFR